jgi:diguanylate cyclase (GGDEF)-like protein
VITLRGQVGVIATIATVVDQPDSFVIDAARLFSQQVGGRLEQLRMIRALTNAATHDVLTGVQNRRGADAQLESLRPGDAVMILDLDHFKTINDTLGHQVGDQVLADFGDYLSNATRPSDMVARYGGEEFIVVCRNAAADVASQVAYRLLDGWRARRPLVTFSVGIAVHQTGDPHAVTLEHADMALYDAKRSGRDAAYLYEPIQPHAEEHSSSRPD